jgi:hypothetical protein
VLECTGMRGRNKITLRDEVAKAGNLYEDPPEPCFRDTV